jgi:acetate kinase
MTDFSSSANVARDVPAVVVINAGSSSIRFALYAQEEPLRLLLDGKVDRIGRSGTTVSCSDRRNGSQKRDAIAIDAGASPADWLVRWLENDRGFAAVKAVGHRLVHGMARTEAARVTPELLDELRGIVPYAPDHLPLEIELLEAFRRRHPQVPQLACFDTAFHRTLPRVASMLPIPRRYEAGGVRRYGFHGLSYAYLMEELARLGDRAATVGRVILMHLGSGASLAAVHDGKSVDTSMGFTPASGLMMGSRSGDLDPGLISYLSRTEHMSAARFEAMVNHDSGLLGVAETSSDMRDLLALEGDDVRAAEAIALFCYQAKKWIGAFAAALGGVDTLVFAGGIGESSPIVRERICAGLGFLGIDLDPSRNAANAALISPSGSAVNVRVIRTDEQLMIARSVVRVLDCKTSAHRP